MRLSVTARIALLAIALALVSSLGVLAVVRHQVRAEAVESLRRDVGERADLVVGAARGSAAAARRIVADADDPDDADAGQALYAGDGRRLSGRGPDRLATPVHVVRFRVARLAGGGALTDGEVGYALRPIGDAWLLTLRRTTDLDQRLAAVERALAVATLVAVLLGVAGGLIVSRYVAQRLGRIADVVAAVGEGALDRRVPIDAAGRGDAFDRLSVSLNATLDRLGALMAELRVMSDGLAHDLRSPLARLRSKAEQAVLLDGDARDAALGGLLAETDLVMRMLATMIEISRSEQVSRDRFTLVDPAELVASVAELYQPMAEDAGFAFTVDLSASPTAMRLHRELLSQALANLLDNALKHAAEGRSVAIRLGTMPGWLAIDVADRGPGIAEQDRATARRRFGRLDAARTAPGAGLGLALVEAVARLHDGRFELDDNAPGLIARLLLPL